MQETTGMLRINDAEVTYGHGARTTRILNGIRLQITEGQTLGLVGESGSGKSTLAKAIVGSIPLSAGSIVVDGIDVATARGKDRDRLRRTVQMIPQDPYSSLNPRQTIGEALAEALQPHRASVTRNRVQILRWLERVRMPADSIDRYPHEFSGGQRQRIAIARGLMIEPQLIIADEITSALDVSVQAEILVLLEELRRELTLTMMFISHNLAVVRNISDEVAVLYHGDLVEHGTASEVYRQPAHPYTRTLLNADPTSSHFSLS